jgi:hypothetical protein
MDGSLGPHITVRVANSVSNGFFAEADDRSPESINVSGKTVIIHEPVIDLLEKLYEFTREYPF